MPRFQINQLIGYFPNREEYLWAEGMEISAAGLRCRAKEPVDPLLNVFMMIAVPAEGGDRLVRCEGHVAHSHYDGQACTFGVCFDRIFEEDRPYFDEYLSRLRAAGLELASGVCEA